MFDFLILHVNLPFTIALTIMTCITIVEVCGLLFGISMSHFLEHDAHLDHDATGSPKILNSFFAWIGIGKVPISILLIIGLLYFGLIGLMTEAFTISLLSWQLYSPLAVIFSLSLSLFLLRITSKAVAKIIPKDESDVISENDLIGKTAIVTLGTASHNNPAQAKIRLSNEQTIYVMVEPDQATENFSQHQKVLLVRKGTGKYYVIKNNDNSFLI